MKWILSEVKKDGKMEKSKVGVGQVKERKAGT